MLRKSKYSSDKKRGYIQIDFLFASFSFFLLLFTIYHLYDSNMSNLEKSYQATRLKSLATDTCFLLSKTPGIPNNWEVAGLQSATQLGLKNQTSEYLDPNKINALSQNLYKTLIDKIDIDEFININLFYVNNNSQIASFGSPPGSFSNFERSICYSIYNTHPVKIVVEVWKWYSKKKP